MQCPFRRFRSSSLMRGNQCGRERKEARRILHSRAKFFWNISKYRCMFYKVLNYQLSVTGGSSFVQRTQILSTFFRGFLLFILSFILSSPRLSWINFTETFVFMFSLPEVLILGKEVLVVDSTGKKVFLSITHFLIDWKECYWDYWVINEFSRKKNEKNT